MSQNIVSWHFLPVKNKSEYSSYSYIFYRASVKVKDSNIVNYFTKRCSIYVVQWLTMEPFNSSGLWIAQINWIKLLVSWMVLFSSGPVMLIPSTPGLCRRDMYSPGKTRMRVGSCESFCQLSLTIMKHGPSERKLSWKLEQVDKTNKWTLSSNWTGTDLTNNRQINDTIESKLKAKMQRTTT